LHWSSAFITKSILAINKRKHFGKFNKNNFENFNLTMATGGSAPAFSADGISSATNLTMELINRLINVQLGEVAKKIEGIEGQLNASRNEVDDYKIHTIDPNIKWETTLGIVKSLPKFWKKRKSSNIMATRKRASFA